MVPTHQRIWVHFRWSNLTISRDHFSLSNHSIIRPPSPAPSPSPRVIIPRRSEIIYVNNQLNGAPLSFSRNYYPPNDQVLPAGGIREEEGDEEKYRVIIFRQLEDDSLNSSLGRQIN